MVEEHNKSSLRGMLIGRVNRKLFLGFLVIAVLVLASGFFSYASYLDSVGSAGQKDAGFATIVGASVASLSKTGLSDLSSVGALMPLVSLLIGTLAISLGLSISHSVSNPIRQLQKATQELERGNFNVRVDIQTADELEELGNSFNNTARALGRLDEERKQLDKAKTEFLSITSHELRSPMTPMKAQLQMLMKEYFGRLTKRQRNAISIVLKNTSRLDTILLDFLDISRIEAARLKFHFTRTNMIENIETLIEEMNGFMPEKKLEIAAKIGKLPVIEVDPDRVMQVLRNLMNNAIKFSRENGRITVKVEYRDGMIVFSVKDSGVGIAPKNQRNIFEPFFQEEQTMYRKYGGTGLGLALCRGIVQSQKGMIWLRSTLGKGSTFYFTVPLTPVKEIKPINLMFSRRGIIEKRVKEAFVDYLGPLGASEFDMITRDGPRYDIIVDHLHDLRREKIIDNDMLRQMTKTMDSVFEAKIST